MLEGKPRFLVKLYLELEMSLKTFGDVELVARDRYALFRTTRIFADLVFMSDALRLAIRLDREVVDSLFFKVQRGSDRRVAHVAKLRSVAQVHFVKPYLEEAYRFSRSEQAEIGASEAKA